MPMYKLGFQILPKTCPTNPVIQGLSNTNFREQLNDDAV